LRVLYDDARDELDRHLNNVGRVNHLAAVASK
jgi:hypothetical protein